MPKRSLTAAVAACLVLAGCGGGHHHAPLSPRLQAGAYNASVHPPGWGTPPAANFRASAGPAAPTGPTATMYDSVTLSTIPGNATAAAGYTSGLFPTWPHLVLAFPHAHKISIAIDAFHAAMCLDAEPGDAVPSQVVGWIRFDIAHGFPHPCVYSSFFEFVNQIQPLIAAAHIPRALIFEWDADYTFVSHIDAGFNATQWTDRCLGRNLDCSLVTLAFLSIASPPLVIVPPDPHHYAWFASGPFPAPKDWGGYTHPNLARALNERALVQRYDALNTHPWRNRFLLHPVRVELRFLRDRLWTVAHRGRICIDVNTCRPVDWAVFHRGFRLHVLLRDTSGVRPVR